MKIQPSIQVQTSYSPEAIRQTTTGLDGHKIAERVVNLQDIGIRRALMKLGWTPPDPQRRPVMQLMLCEAAHTVPQPGRLYRYRVDPQCAACMKMAALYPNTSFSHTGDSEMEERPNLTATEVQDRVRTIICEQIGINPDEVQLESSFVHDLGADSLDMVELAMALEDEFDLIELTDEDMENASTVGDLVNLVQVKLGNEE